MDLDQLVAYSRTFVWFYVIVLGDVVLCSPPATALKTDKGETDLVLALLGPCQAVSNQAGCGVTPESRKTNMWGDIDD